MLTTYQPRYAISPGAISPINGADLQENPFDTEFQDTYDEEETDIEDALDFSTPDEESAEVNNFAVLNSSLPEQLPEQHHLASYVTARRSGAPREREKKQHRTKWHFGIRSRSPPMEVMLEIYRTLKALGMEWKEKKDLGGLGGVVNGKVREKDTKRKIDRAREYDGAGFVDLKKAASIYFVETRARMQDVVVGSCISDSQSIYLLVPNRY
jgi:carbon catabolite-derepressing protein kinase